MQTDTATDSHPLVNQSATERERILDALRAWVAQRPGLDPRNYIGDWRDTAGRAAYRAESRAITRDKHDALALLRAVEWRTGIDADMLKDSLRESYSDRLSWDGQRLDYCTGQYWPTEYRRAACAVLASALWKYTRDNMVAIDGAIDGDTIRARLRREFGRSIAARWFR
jgi:hypothetical protein